ncbi:MAG: efflux RND transporter periplasmic adaptor subunit, partial [Alphaproteobacteria bacterium]|nr:efflux RND transporter periplasmic adaptor subunit [Alphaproteobacteria bacterium]
MTDQSRILTGLTARLRGKSSILVAAFLVVAVTIWMASGTMGTRDRTGPNGATPASNEDGHEQAELFSVLVQTSEAQSRPERIVINGRTEPFRTVEIRAEIEGRLVDLQTYRGERVSKGDIVAKIALYDRRAKLAQARALLRQREIEYAASESLVDQGFRSETQHAGATAQLDAARAVVEQRRADIERTNVRAPFDGIIHGGHRELGDYVKAGDVIGTILDLDPILVVGHATEMEVSGLTLGGPGAAQLVDETILVGTVTYVASQADQATRTYRYEIEVPNPDNEIRAGLTARTIVEAGEVTAHLIPASSLTLSDIGEIGVKLVDDDGIVLFHIIRIMEDGADGMWIDGLPQSVRLIVTGHEFVTVGQRVRPV